MGFFRASEMTEVGEPAAKVTFENLAPSQEKI
jgi:hypothetical protein